ncbi:MAG: ATP-binding protein [Candidatus Omnitrophica bacterium]|nr:ATP-binding protein [Candidatus Omnitrophota bacterium]
MDYINRQIESSIFSALSRNKSVLLLGARQTGKTTIISRLKSDLFISLVRPELRLRYEKDPSLLTSEVEALNPGPPSSRSLIIIDEIQKVPVLLDAVQDLIDRKIANFILTGSSARKLKRGSNVNLLPGRVVSLNLAPFSLSEYPTKSIQQLLLYGSLPGIVLLNENKTKDADLDSYVTTYLEEEVRAEAIVRSLGSFAKFLEYAASESGNIMNFRKLSQEIGAAHTTIASYFQILEDCLIIERIDPISKSLTRKKLTKSSKYLFFDLGVRRLAAKEGTSLPRETMGKLFEQFVGLELLKSIRLSSKTAQLKFWRDPNGPEVDWVVETQASYVPFEVKWSEAPSIKDAKGLQIFLEEYKEAEAGYIVCRSPRRFKLADNVTAVPWQELPRLLV